MFPEDMADLGKGGGCCLSKMFSECSSLRSKMLAATLALSDRKPVAWAGCQLEQTCSWPTEEVGTISDLEAKPS